MTQKLFAIFSIVVGVLALSAPVLAHHGGAAYDTAKSVTVKGTVVEFQFMNPHCQLFVEAPDENGKPVKWNGEFTNPGALHRRGWTREMFKPGDPITMTGNRAKNGSQVLRVLRIGLSDGRTLTALGGDDEN